MSNPFEFFAGDDDEDSNFRPVAVEHKQKRTHAEKRMYKQQQQVKAQAVSSSAAEFNEPLPEKHKDDAKVVRNPRHPPTPLTKKLGEGHFHDKRSGTGRVYR